MIVSMQLYTQKLIGNPPNKKKSNGIGVVPITSDPSNLSRAGCHPDRVQTRVGTPLSPDPTTYKGGNRNALLALYAHCTHVASKLNWIRFTTGDSLQR